MLVVTSVGNEGSNAWNFLLAPSDADSALSIGAVGTTKIPAYFSSPGPNAAGRIKPDVCAQGNPTAVFSSSNSIVNSTGTSWATPQLAGWAACLWEANDVSPYALRQAIITSADHYTTPGPQIGYGVPDFKKAHKSLEVLRVPSFIISPNPFTDYVLVQLAYEAPVQAQFAVFDLAGRRVQAQEMAVESGNQNIRLQLPPGLPAGIYFLRTTIDGKPYLNKLVKL